MKIAIIDVSGKKGTAVAKEALRKGYQVAGVVVRKSEAAPNGVELIDKNVFYLTASDLSGFDAVIDMFEQSVPEKAFQYQTVALTLINAIKEQKGTRLVISGGLDNTSHQMQALDVLKESNILWKYYDSASSLNVTNEDYAARIIDELEKEASKVPSVRALNEKDRPSIGELPDQEYLPQNNLKDKAIHVVMDDCTEGTIVFLTDDVLLWAPIGKKAIKYSYSQNKLDNDTYIITAEMEENGSPTAYIMVLDLEQELTTAITINPIHNREESIYVNEKVTFGVIKTDGKDLPIYRHSFTDDLVGISVKWNIDNKESVFIYYDPYYMRTPLPEQDDVSRKAERMREKPCDVRCAYIKIKEGVYLIAYPYSNLSDKNDSADYYQVLLMNKYTLQAVGKTFGSINKDSANGQFSATGMLVNIDSKDRNRSKYRV